MCTDSSIWVRCCATHNPNTFCTKFRPLHFGQLFSPCRALPNAMCSIFPACVWSLLATTLVHHMFLVCLCCCCFFRISCTDMRVLQRTTPFDASLLHLFCCQKPTFLLAAAQALHNLFIPPPGSGSYQHIAKLHKPHPVPAES